jgi:hypothetical protein
MLGGIIHVRQPQSLGLEPLTCAHAHPLHALMVNAGVTCAERRRDARACTHVPVWHALPRRWWRAWAWHPLQAHSSGGIAFAQASMDSVSEVAAGKADGALASGPTRGVGESHTHCLHQCVTPLRGALHCWLSNGHKLTAVGGDVMRTH